MKAIAPHLYSRNGHLYYRLSIPLDLYFAFEKREIILSLGTKDATQARLTAAQLDFLYTKALNAVRARYTQKETSSPLEEIKNLKDALNHSAPKIVGHRGKIDPTVERRNSNLFSVVWPVYLENCQTDRPKTKDHKKKTFELFQLIVGDKEISLIGKADVRNFLNQLPKISLKARNDKFISPHTINTRISGLSSLFRWLEKSSDGKIQNPFKDTKVKEDHRKKRPGFKREEIATLFKSPIYQGCLGSKFNERLKGGNEIIRDSLYWVPLIGYYSGMRLNEICQLHVEDIQYLDDIWYFDINQQGEKTLKTSSSQRKVPIHSALITHGLIKYIQTQNVGEVRRVFKDLKAGPYGNYGFYFTKRFNLLLKALDIKRQGLCFHSFRHTFIDNLKEAGVERAVAMALCGHSSGKSVHDLYGSGYSLKTLQFNIEKIITTPESHPK